MKDLPAVHSSLIARLVQKTRIKQRAKQMAQMRAARGSQIPKKIISIMMPKEEQRMKHQLSTNEETKKTGKWKTDNDWKKDSYWDVLKILPKQCLNSCHCFEEQFVWPRCSETCFRYTYHCG